MKYIDAVRLRAEIEKAYKSEIAPWLSGVSATSAIYDYVLPLIDSLQQEPPDKETILRICKLHKAWSIMAPWENVEDFVVTNWNAENIV